MTECIIKKQPYDLGGYLRHIHLNALVGTNSPRCPGIANGASVKSHLALPCSYTPLDVDSSVMDQPEGRRTPPSGGSERSEGFGTAKHNNSTAKELVRRSCASVSGYCPIASYLGAAGFCRALAAVAMTVLRRLIGQHTPHGKDALVRRKASRRRNNRTVMPQMIEQAARVPRHALRCAPSLGANDAGFAAFERHRRSLSA